jgi:hypothetical protein
MNQSRHTALVARMQSPQPFEDRQRAEAAYASEFGHASLARLRKMGVISTDSPRGVHVDATGTLRVSSRPAPKGARAPWLGDRR